MRWTKTVYSSLSIVVAEGRLLLSSWIFRGGVAPPPRHVDIPWGSRAAATAGTWIFRGGVAAGRGDAAASTWIFCGVAVPPRPGRGHSVVESRRRRGRDVDIPRRRAATMSRANARRRSARRETRTPYTGVPQDKRAHTAGRVPAPPFARSGQARQEEGLEAKDRVEIWSQTLAVRYRLFHSPRHHPKLPRAPPRGVFI